MVAKLSNKNAFDVLEGSSDPEETNEKMKRIWANHDLFSILFLSIIRTAAAVVEKHRV